MEEEKVGEDIKKKKKKRGFEKKEKMNMKKWRRKVK